MATLADLLSQVTDQLAQAGIPSPALDARQLIGYGLGLDPVGLALHNQKQISAEQYDQVIALADMRASRKPLAHITGQRGFWTLTLTVTPDVLDPRPDSETLIEQTLKGVPDKSAPLQIADIGTGSGALLLALLTELPNARGIGLDLSQPALAIARQNAALNGLAARAGFEQSSWLANASGPFDLIISNPPYIASPVIPALEPEVRDHEPRLALDGGADGLDAYRALIPQAFGKLKPGGTICLEIGFDQSSAVQALLAQAGFEQLKASCDLGGNDRCIIAVKPH